MPRALRARGIFLHERLWVRPKASFYKLFLAAGEALRVLRVLAGVSGEQEEGPGNAGEDRNPLGQSQANLFGSFYSQPETTILTSW